MVLEGKGEIFLFSFSPWIFRLWREIVDNSVDGCGFRRG